MRRRPTGLLMSILSMAAPAFAPPHVTAGRGLLALLWTTEPRIRPDGARGEGECGPPSVQRYRAQPGSKAAVCDEPAAGQQPDAICGSREARMSAAQATWEH